MGAREVGFTVLSMSISLIAVFIPILLMGGIVGRLFREFAVTLSVAILISLVVSLTTTPMMCALMLRPPRTAKQERLFGAGSTRVFDALLARLYAARLRLGAATTRGMMMIVLAITVVLNFYLLRRRSPRASSRSRTPGA